MGIVIVAGHARMAPGEIDRLLPALNTMIAASNAEDGCLHYSYARHVGDPDLMIVSERWKDRAALDSHFREPHMAVFNAALAGAKVLEVSVKAYEDGEERVLMGG